MSNISDNLPDIISVLSSIKKESERKKAIDAINEEHKKLLRTEVNSRRIKTNELIKEMMRVDIALNEFEDNYEHLRLNSNLGEIESIDEYIKDIKRYRRKLALEKNKKVKK